MEYRIITSTCPEGLTDKVNKLVNDDWKPVGGHSVVETHRQNRYRGTEHIDTIIKIEYSQTMIKE